MTYCRPTTALFFLLSLAALTGAPATVEGKAKPRLLVLPWLVIDRTTSRDCTLPAGGGAAGNEARRLAASAQAALNAEMHDLGMLEMIPRKEWQPRWDALQGSRMLWKDAGCAVCAPAGALIRHDRSLVQQLARQVQANYVWLGVTVTPLTSLKDSNPADDCCREALARERPAVLARSSVLLLRANDCEVIWQRDMRRLERDVPRRVGKINRTPGRRRIHAVEATARLLGKAFRREHREALR